MSDTSRTDVPTLGEHALAYQRIGGGLDRIVSPPLSLSETKSILIASVGRGEFAAFETYDVYLDETPLRQIGSAQTYTNWPNSGTAMYVLERPSGNNKNVVNTATSPNDEVTLAVVEVFGSRLIDFAWNEDLYPSSFWRLRRWLFSENSVKSASVETDGPATLIAFWWGDANVEGHKTATPNAGFKVIDAVLDPGALVQCAVATKRVEEAGRYDVTWTNSPLQGAQLWLLAIAD